MAEVLKTFPDVPASYSLTHIPSGCYYVGSTNNLCRRLRRHKDDLNNGNHHNKMLQDVYDGWDNISIRYTECLTVEEANNKEQTSLDFHVGKSHCVNVGRGVFGPWKGGVPEGQREKMSEGIRRYCRTDEARERLRLQALGHKHSDGHKKAISDSLRGIKRSPETISKLSNRRKSTVEKNRLRYNGKAISPEHSFKISLAQSTAVIVEGVRYASATEAANAFSIVKTTVMNRIRSSDPKFQGWTLA